MHICLLAQTLGYIEGGGHFWVYLNWGLGFHRAGARVTWLETVPRSFTPETFASHRTLLKNRLYEHGLPADLAFIHEDGEILSEQFGPLPVIREIAESSDLLVNLCYGLSNSITQQFHRKALIDIDPGLLQHWVTRGYFALAPYDFYFTISDAIGKPGHPIPTLGLKWFHTAPCVDTASWPVTSSTAESPYTTVSHWEAHEYVVEEDGSFYENTKKAGFEPFLDLPGHLSIPVELALCIDPAQTQEIQRLRELGWRIRPSSEVSKSPIDYQGYIQQSRGEFSVSKPSYVKMQSGWISDRTLCYLSSGKPVIVQDTGPIHYVSEGLGLLRFRTLEEAARHFQSLFTDYPTHSQSARHLAESIFDSRRVAERFLDVVFG